MLILKGLPALMSGLLPEDLPTVCFGVVPFLSFWMEHKRRKEIKEEFQL